jgi:hypothetical protein
MGDNIAGPSLLLAKHDLAHREHLHHQHNHLHRRQAVVTEIVATVSVVQQVDVDSNGYIYSTETLTTEPSPAPAPAITGEPASTTTTAESPASLSPESTGLGGGVGGSQASQAPQSLLSDQGTTSSSTISIPTHFPTLILSVNSTSCESTGQLKRLEETD